VNRLFNISRAFPTLGLFFLLEISACVWFHFGVDFYIQQRYFIFSPKTFQHSRYFHTGFTFVIFPTAFPMCFTFLFFLIQMNCFHVQKGTSFLSKAFPTFITLMFFLLHIMFEAIFSFMFFQIQMNSFHVHIESSFHSTAFLTFCFKCIDFHVSL
jgi:hypothetical protein